MYPRTQASRQYYINTTGQPTKITFTTSNKPQIQDPPTQQNYYPQGRIHPLRDNFPTHSGKQQSAKFHINDSLISELQKFRANQPGQTQARKQQNLKETSKFPAWKVGLIAVGILLLIVGALAAKYFLLKYKENEITSETNADPTISNTNLQDRKQFSSVSLNGTSITTDNGVIEIMQTQNKDSLVESNKQSTSTPTLLINTLESVTYDEAKDSQSSSIPQTSPQTDNDQNIPVTDKSEEKYPQTVKNITNTSAVAPKSESILTITTPLTTVSKQLATNLTASVGNSNVTEPKANKTAETKQLYETVQQTITSLPIWKNITTITTTNINETNTSFSNNNISETDNVKTTITTQTENIEKPVNFTIQFPNSLINKAVITNLTSNQSTTTVAQESQPSATNNTFFVKPTVVQPILMPLAHQLRTYSHK